MASETRGRTIPRVAWWCDLATDAVARAGVTRDQLAVELRERFGYVTDETGVSRCLSGKVLTIQLAQHISAILQIPPPVIIPTSEAEAWALLGRREARQRLGVLHTVQIFP